MVHKCCVPNCTSNKNIPRHQFPKDVQRTEIWLAAIKRTDLIGVQRERLDKLRICTIHFSDDSIYNYTQRRILKSNAIPSLYLPSEINDDSEEPRIIMNTSFIPNVECNVPTKNDTNVTYCNFIDNNLTENNVIDSNLIDRNLIDNNLNNIDNNSAKSNLLVDSSKKED
ncbi:THAP domain-containing protein 1-like [Harpegnathos saltator]|uniref:THAP domain-containing protein 1-like n=1 Tax=Harpegnathos saltator TaxID=610380 RepID=UPI000DBED6D2|nr:THAP domain-containing protein 1-like [Harpegnathos saltator]